MAPRIPNFHTIVLKVYSTHKNTHNCLPIVALVVAVRAKGKFLIIDLRKIKLLLSDEKLAAHRAERVLIVYNGVDRSGK